MRKIRQSELDVIAEQIATDHQGKLKKESKKRVLMDWRGKLQKEPTSLEPFQVDQIMRVVQAKLAAQKPHYDPKK